MIIIDSDIMNRAPAKLVEVNLKLFFKDILDNIKMK